MSIAEEVVSLLKLVADMARAGLSDEEIQERMKEPTSVGAKLLKSIEGRKSAGSKYLGRKRK